MQDTKTFTGVLTPYDATYYLMIGSKEFCELYREIEPTGIVLSITPYEVIDEDFEDCLGPVRAHRYEYLVEVRRGKRCDEEYFEKLTPLVEYVLSNAPELTPALYYHLLAAYLESASGAYRTRSLALLGFGQVACTPLEARLAQSDWFPEDELAYREAFYSVCFINGAQFQSAPPELLQRVSPNALRRGVHVITADGRVLRSGRAVLFIGEQLGYGWLTRPLSLPPMVWVVEGVYWVIARLRGKLSRWLRLSETECPR